MNAITTAATTGFDIFNITAPATSAATHKVDLVFNDDGEAVAGFVIVGKNSAEYRESNRITRAEGHQRAAKRKTAIDASTEGGAGKLVDLIDANQQRAALAVVVDWYGFESAGVPVPFNKDLVKAAFDKYPTWQDKVLADLEVDSNFLKVSSPASSNTPTTSSNE